MWDLSVWDSHAQLNLSLFFPVLKFSKWKEVHSTTGGMLVTNYICRATSLVSVFLSMIHLLWILSRKKSLENLPKSAQTVDSLRNPGLHCYIKIGHSLKCKKPISLCREEISPKLAAAQDFVLCTSGYLGSDSGQSDGTGRKEGDYGMNCPKLLPRVQHTWERRLRLNWLFLHPRTWPLLAHISHSWTLLYLWHCPTGVKKTVHSDAWLCMLTLMVSHSQTCTFLWIIGWKLYGKTTRQSKSDMLPMVAVTSHDPLLHEWGLSAVWL